MVLRKQTLSVPRRHLSEDIPAAQDVIFNEAQITAWQQQTHAALALISSTVQRVEKPFSGILPPMSWPRRSAPSTLISLWAATKPRWKSCGHFTCAMPSGSTTPNMSPILTARLCCPRCWQSRSWRRLTAPSIRDQSAGGTLIEQKVIDWTLGRIGLPASADGIFTSGGTQSNLMAMLLARDSWCATHHPGHLIKHKGLPAEA